jgi:hypothetical protein
MRSTCLLLTPATCCISNDGLGVRAPGGADLQPDEFDPARCSRAQPTELKAYPGSTSFLLSEVHKDTIVDFIVDIDWTCGTVLTQEEVYPSQGYTFSLSDVGCVGSWPQKFTMRPLPFGAANRLSIERYGNYQGQETLFLTQGPNGEDLFSYQVGAIDIQGELISYDSTVGASIRIDVAEWDGYTVCTPGTYTLPVEQ